MEEFSGMRWILNLLTFGLNRVDRVAQLSLPKTCLWLMYLGRHRTGSCGSGENKYGIWTPCYVR